MTLSKSSAIPLPLILKSNDYRFVTSQIERFHLLSQVGEIYEVTHETPNSM